MPQTTQLDIILELWKAHGIFALGWVFCCFLAVYIVFLHSRISKIYTQYIAATQAANAAVVPLLERSVGVMTHVVSVIDSAVDRAALRDDMMTELKGKLEIVIQTFIQERFHVESAINAGSERARLKAVTVTERDEERAGAGRKTRRRLAPSRGDNSAK